MAELNFGLLTPPGSESIGNAFVRGQDQALAARQAENANALSQYTLSKARREDELTNQMLAGMQGATTIEQQADVLRRGGKYREANDLLTSGIDRQIKLGTLAAQPGTAAHVRAQTDKLQEEARSKAIGEVAGFPDADSANAAINARLANKTIDQSTADQMRLGLTPENFPKWKHDTLIRLTAPADQLKQSAVTTKDTDRGGYIERQTYDAQGLPVGAPVSLPKTPTPGSVPGITQANIAIARARDEGFGVDGVPVNARLGAQPTTVPPVVNNLPGAQQTAASAGGRGPSPREIRDARAKGFNFNPDGTMTRIPGGPADKANVERTPVQETKFKKDLATDFATVTATTQGMQDVLDSIADVRKSDISGATGLQSYLPTFPSGPTAKAETNLANLKGKLTSLGQTIANQSGKIGPMAVQEWTIVRDMVSALDTAVKSGETITRDELEKIEFTAKNVAERLKSKFEGQYGDELPNYPSFAVIPEPKSRLGSAAPAKPQAPAAAAKLYSVSTPDGKTYDFSTPAKAAEFKKAAGIK